MKIELVMIDKTTVNIATAVNKSPVMKIIVMTLAREAMMLIAKKAVTMIAKSVLTAVTVWVATVAITVVETEATIVLTIVSNQYSSLTVNKNKM